jgi:hypothetical protein
MPDCPGISTLGLLPASSLPAEARRRPGALDKYLPRPTHAFAVAEALCCAIGLRCALEANTRVALDRIDDLARGHEYGLLLRALNADSGYRYSAYFRAAGSTLSSVWTFDRERPGVDPWPLGLDTASTPCAVLLANEKPLVVEDGEADRRILPAQRLADMRAFAGVPVLNEEDQMTGVLCHFSPQVVSANPEVGERLEWVARELTSARRAPVHPVSRR